VSVATAIPEGIERAVSFLGELFLPNGRRIADTFEADPWLLDRSIVPALSKREDARPLYRYVWDEEPKGSGKSTRGAALLAVEAVSEPATHCYAIACDEDQARIILDALSGLISSFSRFRSVIRQRQNVFTFSNGSFIRVVASHEPSFHGIGATARRLRFLCDELTQWATPAMFHAALSSMAKVPDSALWVLTNAGIQGSWQEDAREQLRAAGAHMFIAEAGWLPSWVSREDVDALRGTLPEPVWRRYFRNEWVQESSQAISAELWDACRATIPPLDRAPVVVAVDAGLYRDSFAIVAVSRGERARSDGSDVPRFEIVNTEFGFAYMKPVAVEEAPEVWVRACQIWTPAPGTPVDFEEPWRWLSDFVTTRRVVKVAYDEWQLAEFMTRFKRSHGIWVAPFSQGSERNVADSDLLALIQSRRLKHDGHPVLREHALNANFRIRPAEDTGGRFTKSHPSRRIDALVAASMAAAECLRLSLE
jgi:phage terminase large subunit-like protein